MQTPSLLPKQLQNLGIHLTIFSKVSMQSFSIWIDDVTQPKHPYYHPVQALLFGSFSYLSTACLSSTPPKNAMTVTITAYTISQFTAPLFSKWLEPYKDISLVPLVGQVVHITLSFGTANVICRIAGRSISFKAVGAQITFFLSAISLTRLGLHKLRQNISNDKLRIILQN